jgi:hypothetical protein
MDSLLNGSCAECLKCSVPNDWPNGWKNVSSSNGDIGLMFCRSGLSGTGLLNSGLHARCGLVVPGEALVMGIA